MEWQLEITAMSKNNFSMLDKYTNLIFTFTPENTVIGVGDLNNKVIIAYTDLDSVDESQELKTKYVMKLFDVALYKQILFMLFEMNTEAEIVFVNRYDKTDNEEDCVFISRDEYNLIKKEYKICWN